MSEFPIEAIPLQNVRTDGGTQARVGLNAETVSRYAEVLTDGQELPPGRVYRDAQSVNWLARGFHRYAAHEEAGIAAMRFEVRPGGQREALLDAIGDNAEHGLPRSREDLRRAVELLLADPEWCKFSTAQLKTAARVSWSFADKVRKEWDAAHGVTPPEKRTGADGNEYPAQASRAGGSEGGSAAHTRTLPQPGDPPAREGEQDDETPESGDLQLPRVMEDQYSQAVPPELFPVFDGAKKLRACKSALGKTLAEIESLKNGNPAANVDPDPSCRKLSLVSVQKALQDAQDAIQKALPVAVCVECAGAGGECKTCEGWGVLWSARLPSLTNGQRRQLERFQKKAA